MTREEKQLLLKDLCARLPYGVKFHFHQVDIVRDEILNEICIPLNVVNTCYPIDKIKPYLRPMSSMTKEEKEEFISFNGTDGCYIKTTDFCYKHHLDNRGLIPIGWALPASEEMYKTK